MLDQLKDDALAQLVTQIVLIAILGVLISPVGRWGLNKLRARQTQDEERPSSEAE